LPFDPIYKTPRFLVFFIVAGLKVAVSASPSLKGINILSL